MTNIPLDAEVTCIDGKCGTSTTIVVNPISEKITHIVVKENRVPHSEYLVPIERIIETSSNGIRLDCPKDGLRQMETYLGTEFIETSKYEPFYGSDPVVTWPYLAPDSMAVRVEHERIPPGELAVRRGAQVHATDGVIGQVDELLLDPETGHVTHLVLRQGHLWGKRVLTLPVSAIDDREDETVYLKINKKAIGELPSIPIQLQGEVTDAELVIVTYDDTPRAEKALHDLRRFAKQEAIAVMNVAVLVKDEAGKFSLKETADVSSRRGPIFGAVTGGLIGLLGGPIGAAVGAAAGAAVGSFTAKRIDMGLPDEYFDTLQKKLHPGSSALVVLVKQDWADKVVEAINSLDGQLLRHPLSKEVMSKLAAKRDS